MDQFNLRLMSNPPKSKNTKQTVSIVGIGRVGRAFAKALQKLDYDVVALVFRDLKSARSSRYSSSAFLLLGLDELDRLPFSDVILITTPDDAIADTSQKLAEAEKRRKKSRKSRIVLHTSGALSSSILSPLTKAGFFAGSIHPLVAIDQNGEKALRGAYYCVEGHRRAVATAKRIVADLGGESFVVNTEHKALYHAAAVIASPHLVALFDVALELMTLSGVDKAQARKILLRLVESTVENLQQQSPAAALTGTFQRGDVGTVQRHLKALSDKELPKEALEIYRTLGLRSLKLAQENKLDRERIDRIKKLLKS